MKLIDINGRMVSLDISHKTYPPKDSHRSQRQEFVLEIIKLCFLRDTVIEEFVIPGSRMSLDFFIPIRKLAIEVQGEQHNEYIPYFHGDRKYSKSYCNQKLRDSKKYNWCEINKIKLIEIFPHESEAEIKDKFNG